MGDSRSETMNQREADKICEDARGFFSGLCTPTVLEDKSCSKHIILS